MLLMCFTIKNLKVKLKTIPLKIAPTTKYLGINLIKEV